ncbi:hypothetical protein CDD83_469 [Cordyceps sp. RAO-2017]|nr:hypothetical protein CDD83_469 [Cordyceps sp. RAO-2017]
MIDTYLPGTRTHYHGRPGQGTTRPRYLSGRSYPSSPLRSFLSPQAPTASPAAASLDTTAPSSLGPDFSLARRTKRQGNGPSARPSSTRATDDDSSESLVSETPIGHTGTCRTPGRPPRFAALLLLRLLSGPVAIAASVQLSPRRCNGTLRRHDAISIRAD